MKNKNGMVGIIKKYWYVVICFAVFVYFVAIGFVNNGIQEQISEVSMQIFSIDENVTENLYSDNYQLGNNGSANTDTNDFCSCITETSVLKFVYVVKNLSSADVLVQLCYNKELVENMTIEYFVDDIETNNVSTIVTANEYVVVYASMFVTDECCDASFIGDLQLTVSYC